MLDLFCGAGGASVGYDRAGFSVWGVDIKSQRHYPFPFHQADVLELSPDFLQGFDIIHASPPCQRYTRAKHMIEAQGNTPSKVDLIDATRQMLVNSGKPYIIENVVGAPVQGIIICGSAFGLKVRRHRVFESNMLLLGTQCRHAEQGRPVGVYATRGDQVQGVDRKTGKYVYGGRTAATVEEAQEAMGITWMPYWSELKEAIPPAYTEFIGRQIIGSINPLR